MYIYTWMTKTCSSFYVGTHGPLTVYDNRLIAWMDHNLFNHPLIDEHIGGFILVVVVTYVDIFVSIFISFLKTFLDTPSLSVFLQCLFHQVCTSSPCRSTTIYCLPTLNYWSVWLLHISYSLPQPCHPAQCLAHQSCGNEWMN